MITSVGCSNSILSEVLEATGYWTLEQRYENWAVSDKVNYNYTTDGIYMYTVKHICSLLAALLFLICACR